MRKLCRSGYLTDHNIDIKKELTVRPEVNNEFWFSSATLQGFQDHQGLYVRS